MRPLGPHWRPSGVTLDWMAYGTLRTMQSAPRRASVRTGAPEERGTRREVMGVAVAAVALLGILWIRTEHLVPGHSWWAFPGDHHIYLFMAEHPVGQLHLAPWGWRILGPGTVRVLPVTDQLGFQVVTFASLCVAATCVHQICRALGFDRRLAFAGLLLFVALSFATKFAMFDFWLTDPLAFAFLGLAVLFAVEQRVFPFACCLAVGVLAKESVVFAAPLLYTFGADEALDGRAARRALLATIPALVVLVAVRLAIPAWNGQPYALGLPGPIAASARTIPDYSALAVARDTLARRAGAVSSTVVRSISAFGLLVGVLPFIGGRRAARLAVRFAPLLVLVGLQEVFAFNTERLLVLAFPAMIPLAVCGLCTLRDHGVSDAALLGTCGAFAGLQLLFPSEIAPAAPVQVVVLGVCIAWMWLGVRRASRPAVVPA